MYKILNSQGLGVSGKQNELIELALTYGFDGVEVDMVDLVGRHDTLGKQFACQFLQSAKIDMGTFRLPVDLGTTDEKFEKSIEKLETIIDLAKTLNAKCCYTVISGSNSNFSFQECFEKHQSRLQALSEKFEESGIKIGLALKSSTSTVGEGEFEFIQSSDKILALVKAVGRPNVGICLDSWQWVVGGGTIEQLTSAGIDNVVTEVRLADIEEGVEDLDAITCSQRTSLPGDSADSFAVKLCKAILDSDADVPISVATDLSTFADATRDAVVGKLSKQLDLLIAGQNPYELIKAVEEAKAAEADEASEAGEAGVESGTTPVIAAAE